MKPPKKGLSSTFLGSPSSPGDCQQRLRPQACPRGTEPHGVLQNGGKATDNGGRQKYQQSDSLVTAQQDHRVPQDPAHHQPTSNTGSAAPASALRLAAGPRSGDARISAARSKGTFPQPPSKGTIHCKLRNKTMGGGRSIWASERVLLAHCHPASCPACEKATALGRAQGNTRRAHARAGNSLPGTYGQGQAQMQPWAGCGELGLRGLQHLGLTAMVRPGVPARASAESGRSSPCLRAHAARRDGSCIIHSQGSQSPQRAQHNGDAHQAEGISASLSCSGRGCL